MIHFGQLVEDFRAEYLCAPVRIDWKGDLEPEEILKMKAWFAAKGLIGIQISWCDGKVRISEESPKTLEQRVEDLERRMGTARPRHDHST